MNQSSSVQKPDIVMTYPDDFFVLLFESDDFVRIDTLVEKITIVSNQVLLRVKREEILAFDKLLSDLADFIVIKVVGIFCLQLAIKNKD